MNVYLYRTITLALATAALACIVALILGRFSPITTATSSGIYVIDRYTGTVRSCTHAGSACTYLTNKEPEPPKSPTEQSCTGTWDPATQNCWYDIQPHPK
jgi:hypothetical protein